MRILATPVLLVGLVLATLVQTGAGTKGDTNQNAKGENKHNVGKFEENIISWNDSTVSSADKPIHEKSYARESKIVSASLPEGDFVMNASAYTAAADECGKSDGITASGKKVTEGKTIACPPQYKFGTKIEVDGMGTYVCEDRGGAIKGNHFDIYMETKSQAFAFGRRNLIARVVN